MVTLNILIIFLSRNIFSQPCHLPDLGAVISLSILKRVKSKPIWKLPYFPHGDDAPPCSLSNCKQLHQFEKCCLQSCWQPCPLWPRSMDCDQPSSRRRCQSPRLHRCGHHFCPAPMKKKKKLCFMPCNGV